jgi:hypothetical protein
LSNPPKEAIEIGNKENEVKVYRCRKFWRCISMRRIDLTGEGLKKAGAANDQEA